MFNKKAQSQIITTVLIILLVLAAIVIVWQVVQGTVQQGADGISGQGDCFTVGLEIDSIVTMRCNDPGRDKLGCTGLWDDDGDSGTTNPTPTIARVWNEGEVVVKRTPGGGDLKAITVLSDGSIVAEAVDASGLSQLEKLTISGEIFPDKNIEIAAIVGESNKLCGVADSMTSKN